MRLSSELQVPCRPWREFFFTWLPIVVQYCRAFRSVLRSQFDRYTHYCNAAIVTCFTVFPFTLLFGFGFWKATILIIGLETVSNERLLVWHHVLHGLRDNVGQTPRVLSDTHTPAKVCASEVKVKWNQWRFNILKLHWFLAAFVAARIQNTSCIIKVGLFYSYFCF